MKKIKNLTEWLSEKLNDLGDVTNYNVTVPGSNSSMLNSREEGGCDDLRCGYDKNFFYMKHWEWVNKDFDAEIKIDKEQASNLINVLNRFINR